MIMMGRRSLPGFPTMVRCSLTPASSSLLDRIAWIRLPLVPGAGVVRHVGEPRQPEREQADRSRDARIAVGDHWALARDTRRRVERTDLLRSLPRPKLPLH